jgi:hypothetical protein
MSPFDEDEYASTNSVATIERLFRGSSGLLAIVREVLENFE